MKRGPHITQLRGEALRRECALSYGLTEDAGCGNCLKLEVVCIGKTWAQNVCMSHIGMIKGFICPVCGNNEYTLIDQSYLPKRNSFKCEQCSTVFADPKKFIKHAIG